MFVTKDPVLAFLCSQEPEDHVRVRRAVSPPEKIIALTAKLRKVGFGKHFFPQVQFYDGRMHVHDPATGAYSQGVHVCRRTPCRWEGASLIPGISEGFHSVTVFQFCYHSQQSLLESLRDLEKKNQRHSNTSTANFYWASKLCLQEKQSYFCFVEKESEP